MDPLDRQPKDAPLGWALAQLALAYDIVDNPGGGKLFAWQTIGQVRASLQDKDPERWEQAIDRLLQAEEAALTDRAGDCRQDLASVVGELRAAEAAA